MLDVNVDLAIILPIPVFVSFAIIGNLVDVTDFNGTDANTSTDIGITAARPQILIIITGAIQFRFEIIPDRDPQRYSLLILEPQ